MTYKPTYIQYFNLYLDHLFLPLLNAPIGEAIFYKRFDKILGVAKSLQYFFKLVHELVVRP